MLISFRIRLELGCKELFCFLLLSALNPFEFFDVSWDWASFLHSLLSYFFEVFSLLLLGICFGKDRSPLNKLN